jgi:LEA14-like dessication related protein
MRIRLLNSFFLFLLLAGTLASCAVESPEFIGSEGVKLEKMSEGEILFSAGVKVNNPNWFGIKLKKSTLDVYLEEQLVGKIHLEKKVKMRAKRESSLSLPLRASLEDGAMMMLMRYSTKENVNVRFKGKVKGGVWIFSKKIEIDETRQIPGRSLRPGGFQLPSAE